jgi:lipopolysaccharide export system ATP-binding protein
MKRIGHQTTGSSNLDVSVSIHRTFENELHEVSMVNAGGSVLRSRSLYKRYKKRYVVNDVSVDVRQGEVVGLLGPNGAGKTTTFYMMVGMIKPNSGSVFIDDVEITKLPMYKRARLGIGYLPQEPSIFRKLTVEDNIMAVLEYMKMGREQRRERCDSLLDELGIASIRKTLGYALSGGERRRTEIARALACQPKFMLLDEPFAGIDPLAVEDIMKIVMNLKERGIGVLITDHNVHETLSIVDRAYLLFEGRILKSGTSEFLANDSEARKLYLGENFRLDRY